MEPQKDIRTLVAQLDNKHGSIINAAIVERLVDSLEKSPRIGLACKRARISTGTFSNWYRKWPEFAALVDEAQACGVLAVEDRLFQNALTGDTTALIFLMKKWKPERYEDVPKTEPQPVPTEVFDISLLDEEDRAQLQRLSEKARRMKELTPGTP